MEISEVYRASLATSGKLKLRAKAYLASGEEEAVFKACVILHEVARSERRAIEALSNCPAETRLLASVEECWALVEGYDPGGAGEVWGRILSERCEVDEQLADALLSRLSTKYEEQQRAFAQRVTSSAAIMQLYRSRAITLGSSAERKKALRELRTLLATYPGAASLWWMAYRLTEQDNEKEAWKDLTNARQLEPDNRRFEAMSLLLAARALPQAEAEAYLASVSRRLENAGAEVCLMYALAEIQLGRASSRAKQEHWQRAKEAAQAGLSQSTSSGLHKNLRAADMLASTLLAGTKPTIDILYRAGLTHLAVASPRDADVVDLITSSVRDAA